MGYYQVVAPCVVGKLHYTQPHTEPIDVDDAAAAPLVEAGSLVAYRPGGIGGRTGTVLDGAAHLVDEPTGQSEPPRRRGRKSGD